MLFDQLRDVLENKVSRLAVRHVLLVSRGVDPRFGVRVIPHFQNRYDEIFVGHELGLSDAWCAVELFADATD